MQIIADLHLHSKYSRAVSQHMTLPTMALYAKQKGIDLLTVCDWTHPLWLKEVKDLMEEKNEGVYGLKSQNVILGSNATPESDSGPSARMTAREPLFLFSTEIACIYSQGGRVRRIHNLVFVPNRETAEKVQKALLQRGANLSSDGRPIIGMSCRNLLELILEIDERCMLIPCHAWTPHFGVYGSASGFDSLDEAFGDLSTYVYGIETGLSSDPEMNWQMAELQNRSILSFSDAHSLPKMGREATVFELEELSYENIRKAIMRPSRIHDDRKQKIELDTLKKENGKLIQSQFSPIKESVSNFHYLSSNRIIYTIEFYPEEGKYHFSGHRKCKVIVSPEEIAEKGSSMCPVCKRRLTEGVLYRVQQLANSSLNSVETKVSDNGIKWYTDKNKKQPPYVKLVPLLEIVAGAMHATVLSKKVQAMFTTLCNDVGSEIDILLKVPIAEIEKVGGVKIAEGVQKVRAGSIAIDPGFDGEYGKVKIWRDEQVQSTKLKVKNEIGEKEKEQLGLF